MHTHTPTLKEAEHKVFQRSSASREKEPMTPPTVEVHNMKATFVDASELSEDPLRSVGILFFMQGERFRASAYVVNLDGTKNIIFTAAHNLWDEDGLSHHISFVPRMKSRCAILHHMAYSMLMK